MALASTFGKNTNLSKFLGIFTWKLDANNAQLHITLMWMEIFDEEVW